MSHKCTNNDSCTHEGAMRLAEKIHAYWRAKNGKIVSVRFEPGAFTTVMRSTRTDVRSNMVNGWPQ